MKGKRKEGHEDDKGEDDRMEMCCACACACGVDRVRSIK